jgi:hypothetical protein
MIHHKSRNRTNHSHKKTKIKLTKYSTQDEIIKALNINGNKGFIASILNNHLANIEYIILLHDLNITGDKLIKFYEDHNKNINLLFNTLDDDKFNDVTEDTFSDLEN